MSVVQRHDLLLCPEGAARFRLERESSSRVHKVGSTGDNDDDGSGATTKRARSIPVRSRNLTVKERKNSKEKSCAPRLAAKVPSETKKVLDDVHETETKFSHFTDSSRFTHQSCILKTNTGASNRLGPLLTPQSAASENERATKRLWQALARGGYRAVEPTLSEVSTTKLHQRTANFKGHLVRKGLDRCVGYSDFNLVRRFAR